MRRLDDVARRAGIDTRTALMKLCLITFLDHFEKHGVSCLPPDWQQILKREDQRTYRYACPRVENLKVAEKKARYKTGKKKRGGV